jgi:ketosteroid isomerase-like protein
MSDETAIRTILEQWAAMTREGRQDDVLAHHAADVLIFDVLPPLQYDSAAAYRASWGEWQPQTVAGAKFNLENLVVTAGQTAGFAHCHIRCGGTTPGGKQFEDLVRATFCLRKLDGKWTIVHQHISKPYGK